MPKEKRLSPAEVISREFDTMTTDLVTAVSNYQMETGMVVRKITMTYEKDGSGWCWVTNVEQDYQSIQADPHNENDPINLIRKEDCTYHKE